LRTLAATATDRVHCLPPSIGVKEAEGFHAVLPGSLESAPLSKSTLRFCDSQLADRFTFKKRREREGDTGN